MAFAMDNRGGGQALPPYLQARAQSMGGMFKTRPLIKPKASVVPGEVEDDTPPTAVQGTNPAVVPAQQGSIGDKFKNILTKKGGMPAAPNPTPIPNDPGANPAQSPYQKQYDFYKKDLQDQATLLKSQATSGAAARGVYYGTPLTTSLGDIDTEYLKGLGTLDAQLADSQQRNELTRYQMAIQLLNGAGTAGSGAIDPRIYEALGTLLPGGNPSAVAGNRNGPIKTGVDDLSKKFRDLA